MEHKIAELEHTNAELLSTIRHQEKQLSSVQQHAEVLSYAYMTSKYCEFHTGLSVSKYTRMVETFEEVGTQTAYLLEGELDVEFRDAVSLTVARLKGGFNTETELAFPSRIFRRTLAAMSVAVETVFSDPRDPGLVDKFRSRWFLGEFLRYLACHRRAEDPSDTRRDSHDQKVCL